MKFICQHSCRYGDRLSQSGEHLIGKTSVQCTMSHQYIWSVFSERRDCKFYIWVMWTFRSILAQGFSNLFMHTYTYYECFWVFSLTEALWSYIWVFLCNQTYSVWLHAEQKQLYCNRKQKIANKMPDGCYNPALRVRLAGLGSGCGRIIAPSKSDQ